MYSKKKIKRFFIYIAGAIGSSLLISTSFLANSYNINTVGKALSQERSYTSNFDYSYIGLRNNSIIPPYWNGFNAGGFGMSNLLGSTNLKPRKWPILIRINDEYNPGFIKLSNFEDPWRGMWTNMSNYGEISNNLNDGLFFRNYFNLTQYDAYTQKPTYTLIPRLNYLGQKPHNTLLGKTRAYVLQIPDNTLLSSSKPTVVFMAKTVDWNKGGFNVTNRSKIALWDKNNLSDPAYILDDKIGSNPNGAFASFYSQTDHKDGKKRKYFQVIHFILSNEYGTSGRTGIYLPSGDTQYQFHSLENSSMPSLSSRGDYLATEWVKKIMSEKRRLLDYSATNAIPATYYASQGTIVGNNLTGEIKITVSSGVRFKKVRLVTSQDAYSGLRANYYTYQALPKETKFFTYNGFKKVTPTQLITKIDVNNPYIQPQYVTSDEIKKIILTKGISGSLPDGFSIDNIIINNIQRYNNYGTIRVNVYLNLYYDGSGDLRTTHFSPQDVLISGWAQTNYSFLPTKIVTKNSTILPTDVSSSQIQDIIYNYLVENKMIWVPGKKNPNACFPQNFLKEDIIIKNENIKADNLYGKITVDVLVKNFFNDKGEIVSNESNLGRVTITGYKSVQPTIIGKDTYDFVDPSNELYPTDVASQLFLLKNFIGIMLLSPAMKPENFEPLRDIQLANIVTDNIAGTLTADVSFNNYYDNKGIVRQTGFEPRTITFNFEKSISKTILPEQIDVSSKYGEVPAFSINEEQVKQIIIDNMLLGKPDDFATSNIKFKSEPVWDSARGKIVVTPTLDYWVNDLGEFQTSSKTFNEIDIYGFLGSPITRVNEKMLPTGGDSKILPTTVARNPEEIKEFVSSLLIGKPNEFSNNNIIIKSTKPDNTNGSLQVTFSLNYYNDKNGNPKTNGFEDKTIVIEGFATSLMPTTINSYIAGDSETIAQHYTNDDLISSVIENTNNPADGFNKSNISLKDIDYDYLNGRISFTPVLNLWIADDLSIHTEPKEFNTVTITGFRRVNQTYVNTSSLNVGSDQYLPSEFASDYSENLLPMVDKLIENKPDDWDIQTSITLTNIDPNDLDGSISMDITLNNYYDENGLLKSIGFLPVNIKITGFAKITGKTSIDSTIAVSNFSDVFPYEVTEPQVIQMVFENLKNKVPGMTIHNVSLYASFRVDNFKGTITTTPYIDCYYDENGKIINEPLVMNEVIFTGFKHSPGVTSISTKSWVGNPNLLPNIAVKDVVELKNQVYKKIVNVPENFDYLSDIEITNIFHDNITGTVSFDLFLKRIYDDNGVIQSGEFPFGNIVIYGYKTATGVTSIPSRILTTNPNVYASDFTIDQYIKILFDNIKNPPSELSISDVKIKNNEIDIDNRLGTASFTPILNWTYNIYGELVNIPKEFAKVTIYGFLKSSETIISTTTISAKKYPTIKDLYPNELSNNVELLQQLTYDIIRSSNVTVPSNFSSKNIEILSSDFDNYTGSINYQIRLNNYFDKDGVVQNTGFLPITITVVDLQKTPGVTSILKIINSSDSTQTPQQITDDQIKNFVIKNISNPPKNLTVDDISFKTPPMRNNLNGTITLIPILSKSYGFNNNLIETPVEFQQITIKGFATTSPTTLKNNNINYEFSNVLPSELANDTNQIKTIIYNNLQFLPPTFDIDTDISINSNSLVYDNLRGQISFSFSLSKYFDEKGIYKETGFIPEWVTITDLLIVSKTTLVSNENIVPDVVDIIPSDYTDLKINDYIKTNISSSIFENIPLNFDVENDMSIIIKDKNNISGTISIEIVLKKYYDDSGQLINDANGKSFFLNLTGFKSVKQTKIVDECTVLNQSNILPQSLANNMSLLSNAITNNVSTIFENAPSSLSVSDIVFDENSVKSYDNLNGSITIEIGLRNYYNQNGNHVVSYNNKNILKNIVKINGFAKKKETTIADHITLQNYDNVLASSINNSDVMTILLNNSTKIFSSLPSTDSLNQNLETKLLTFDNEEGYVKVAVTLYEYFNENGDVVNKIDNKPLTKIITISGFSSAQPTSIANYVQLSDQNNTLASTVSEDQLKKMLYSSISQLLTSTPNDFSLSDNMSISILGYDNLRGEITINVSLNYYIDDMGNIVNATKDSELLNQTVVVGGFKTVKATAIVDNVHLNGYKKVNPYEIDSTTMKNIILSNKREFFINLPKNFEDAYLDVNILSVNKRNGSIDVNITISNYYDENESLVTNGALSKNVNVSGFLKINSPDYNNTTLIVVSTIAAILTVGFVIGLAIAFKTHRRKIRL